MDFIDSLDNQQSAPPFFFPGMVIRNFLLRADQQKLQDYCDQFLNAITPGQYFQVLAPFVFLSINSYPEMLLEDHQDLGFSSQNEFFLMLPVLRYQALGTVLLPAELTWVFPFIGVDNATSAIAGQTTLGFPKMLGKISAVTDATGAFTSEVTMPGFAALSRNSAQEQLLIISVATEAAIDPANAGQPAPAPGPNANQAPAAPPFPWTFFDHAGIQGELSDVALALLDLIEAAPDLFSVTTLKQIRSATDPKTADLSQLLRGEWQLSNTTAPVMWDAAGVAVAIYDNQTTQIAQKLGLHGDMQANDVLNVPVLSAYSLTVDMRFANFTTLV